MKWVLGVVALTLTLLACRDNPNIDGSKVAVSAASCKAVCARLVDLCGYAPPDCDDDDVDAAGYCQTNMDDTMLACMSTAPSCLDAWNCTPAPPVDEDAGADAGDDASSDDGATE